MKLLLALSLSALILGAGCDTSGLLVNQSVQPKTPGAAAKRASPSGTVLDLSGRGLTAIPMEVFSRTDLVSLNLSNNRLTGAPQAEIRHLQKLKSLDLSGNSLTGLPAELGQLKELETLDVSNNQLTGLPMELGDLTQLRILDITGNKYSARDLDEIAKKLTQTEIRR